MYNFSYIYSISYWRISWSFRLNCTYINALHTFFLLNFFDLFEFISMQKKNKPHVLFPPIISSSNKPTLYILLTSGISQEMALHYFCIHQNTWITNNRTQWLSLGFFFLIILVCFWQLEDRKKMVNWNWGQSMLIFRLIFNVAFTVHCRNVKKKPVNFSNHY